MDDYSTDGGNAYYAYGNEFDASPGPGPCSDSSSNSSSTDGSGTTSPSGSDSSSGSGSDSGTLPGTTSGNGTTTTTTTPAYTGSFNGASAGALRLAIENREPRSLFAGSGGFARMWDACSSTPYLRSARAGQVVAYDDPVSLEMKAQLVRQAGMRGVNVFDVHGDTEEWDLADGVRRGLGLV